MGRKKLSSLSHMFCSYFHLEECILYLQTQDIGWKGDRDPSATNWASEEGLTKHWFWGGGMDQKLLSWGGRNFTSPHQDLLRPQPEGMYIISPNTRKNVWQGGERGVLVPRYWGWGGERGNLWWAGKGLLVGEEESFLPLIRNTSSPPWMNVYYISK